MRTMSEFKVGDRVRIIESGFVGTIEKVVEVDNPHYSCMYKVADKYKCFYGLYANELELIEKAKEPTTLEDLEQRIEKLEKCVMGEENNIEKCENVSSMSKTDPKEVLKKSLEANWQVLNIPKPSLLTEDERVILRNVDECCKWISRDRIGDLFVYNNRPEKEALLWVCSGINGLSKSLENIGFRLIRLKTGTPPRIKKDSIDFSKMQEENGDNCFGGDSKFASMEDYSIAIGTLSNCATYMAQLDQAQKVQKAQRDNVIQLQKNAKEAKK